MNKNIGWRISLSFDFVYYTLAFGAFKDQAEMQILILLSS